MLYIRYFILTLHYIKIVIKKTQLLFYSSKKLYRSNFIQFLMYFIYVFRYFLSLDIFFVSLKHWCDEIMIVNDSEVIHFNVWWCRKSSVSHTILTCSKQDLRNKDKENPRRVSVRYRPKTLQRSSQRTFHNSRVL